MVKSVVIARARMMPAARLYSMMVVMQPVVVMVATAGQQNEQY